MESRSRILAILNILYLYSDDEHFVNATFIAEKLRNDYHIEHCDRKTIYSDIKALNELGYQIEYNDSYNNNGYNLYGNPFNLAEIKILKDMVNSFKPLDDKSTAQINAKLDNFTSKTNREFLRHINLLTKKKDNHLIYHLEIILKAIRNEETLEITDKHNNVQTIIPYLLHYTNNSYYLYYQYIGKDKNDIYHMRLDRILKVGATGKKHFQRMRIEECKKIIAESYDSFKGKETTEIVLEVSKDYILEDLKDNFDKIIVKNERFVSLKTSISDNLFGKLCSYGDGVKIISPQTAVDSYVKFLKKTISQYD